MEFLDDTLYLLATALQLPAENAGVVGHLAAQGEPQAIDGGLAPRPPSDDFRRCWTRSGRWCGNNFTPPTERFSSSPTCPARAGDLEVIYRGPTGSR